MSHHDPFFEDEQAPESPVEQKEWDSDADEGVFEDLEHKRRVLARREQAEAHHLQKKVQSFDSKAEKPSHHYYTWKDIRQQFYNHNGSVCALPLHRARRRSR